MAMNLIQSDARRRARSHLRWNGNILRSLIPTYLAVRSNRSSAPAAVRLACRPPDGEHTPALTPHCRSARRLRTSLEVLVGAKLFPASVRLPACHKLL